MEKRLKKLHTFMREHGLEGMIINKPENRRYFSGFTGSAGLLLISLKSQQLFTDFRYKEQATLQAGQYEVVQYTNNPYELLGKS
ncbi:MAG TPA: aminopeptidase P family N-terminal domain-containing protein, partial [Negativicutes bacterium]